MAAPITPAAAPASTLSIITDPVTGKSFARDASNPSSTYAPYTTPAATTPAAPAKPDYAAEFNAAGAAGASTADISKFFGATPEEQQAAKDSIAKELGYDSADALLKDAYTAPSEDTTQIYNDAYAAAGLGDLQNQINAKKQSLIDATGKINDNPWLDEASRVGRTKNLQELANADIANLQNEYNTKLGEVKNLVSMHATDLGNNQKLAQAKLAYLEKAATDAATATANSRISQYYGDYAAGKAGTKKPQTVHIPTSGATYQWNPTTQTFEALPVATAAPAGKAPAGKTGTSPVTRVTTAAGKGSAKAPKTATSFQFTPKQLLTLQTRGLSGTDATGILADIKAGHPLEDIRQNMKAQGLDPGLLDNVMGFVDPAHNKVQ